MSDSNDGMYDPNAGRVDLEGAATALGLDEESEAYLRNVALLTIIKDRLEITDEEIDIAYEQIIKTQLKDAVISISSLVRGGLDE